MEDKVRACNDLLWMLQRCDRTQDVADLVYEEIGRNEFVNIVYKSGATKVVNVSMDSEPALWRDVLKRIDG